MKNQMLNAILEDLVGTAVRTCTYEIKCESSMKEIFFYGFNNKANSKVSQKLQNGLTAYAFRYRGVDFGFIE